MGCGRFSAAAGPCQHHDMGRAVIGDDMASDILQIFCIGSLNLGNHTRRIAQGGIVDLLEVADIFKITAAETAHKVF